jgi:hypothetical protein
LEDDDDIAVAPKVKVGADDDGAAELPTAGAPNVKAGAVVDGVGPEDSGGGAPKLNTGAAVGRAVPVSAEVPTGAPKRNVDTEAGAGAEPEGAWAADEERLVDEITVVDDNEDG